MSVPIAPKDIRNLSLFQSLRSVSDIGSQSKNLRLLRRLLLPYQKQLSYISPKIPCDTLIPLRYDVYV